MIFPPIWSSTKGSGCDDRFPSYKIGACLITQDSRGLQLLFHIAGVKTEDLSVEIVDGILTVSGHVMDNGRIVSEFERTLNVDIETFDAAFASANVVSEQGVLVVRFPTHKHTERKSQRDRKINFWYRRSEPPPQPPLQEFEKVEVTLLQPKIVDEQRRPVEDNDRVLGNRSRIGMIVSF